MIPDRAEVGVDVGSYLGEMRRRLAEDGCEVRDDQVGPLRALVGYRSDFLPQLMFSRLHLFTVAASLPEVTPFAVQDFSRHVSTYAKAARGGMRGLQSGIAAFVVLLSDRVGDEAKAAARRPARVEFAVRCQPVLVDLSRGTVDSFRGRQVWGFLMNGHLRRKLNRYVPDPAGRL